MTIREWKRYKGPLGALHAHRFKVKGRERPSSKLAAMSRFQHLYGFGQKRPAHVFARVHMPASWR